MTEDVDDKNRNKSGRFVKGCNPNPEGKNGYTGLATQLRKATEPQLKAIIDQTITMAVEGDLGLRI